jgi:spermidine synthase
MASTLDIMPDKIIKRFVTAVAPETTLQTAALREARHVPLKNAPLASRARPPRQVVERAIQHEQRSWDNHIENLIPDLDSDNPGAFERLLRESNGKPFVYDDGDMRSLHFDERLMQSAMWLEEPDKLVFGYTRAMMGFLLFNPAPHHILMVGLGGGSLAKYCYRHLPSTHITVLEVDADVIALRDKFMIPADNDRFQVIHADAIDYIAHADQNVDVILLDGFNIDGVVPELNSQSFYAACQRILNPQGILVANLWSEAADLTILMGRLLMEFDYRVWRVRSIDSHNLLLFSFNSMRNSPLRRSLMKQAIQLDQRFMLGLPQLVERLHATTTDSPLVSGTGSPVNTMQGGKSRRRIQAQIIGEKRRVQ